MIGVHPACVLKMLVFCNPSIHYACQVYHHFIVTSVIIVISDNKVMIHLTRVVYRRITKYQQNVRKPDDEKFGN
jgi:hypothetical protein